MDFLNHGEGVMFSIMFSSCFPSFSLTVQCTVSVA
jgi:hypothetical protein